MITAHEIASALQSGELSQETLAEGLALWMLRETAERHAEASEGEDDQPTVESIQEGADQFLSEYSGILERACELCYEVDPENYMR